MKPGPKPTPTKLRVLNGDHHKSRYNFDEPTSGELDASDMPESVAANEYAAEMWTYLVPKIIRMGIVADVDRMALEGLAVAYGMWRLQPTPTLWRPVAVGLSEFGLTPASRTRLVGNLPHEKAEDPIEAKLARN